MKSMVESPPTCLLCKQTCERAPSCYACAARSAGFVLSQDPREVAAFWRITAALATERCKTETLQSLKRETTSVQASTLAGLAVGMLAIGDSDAAVACAAMALHLGPEAHGPWCCSAAEVLFSPKLFRPAAEAALRSILNSTGEAE